jgi:uncharacterized glyoxalase superfamily protein PhnB
MLSEVKNHKINSNDNKLEDKMGNFISKICSHIYVEGALEAVKLYKEAFGLEVRGTPWLDDDGVLVYQELGRNGELFISVSDRKHLFAEFIKDYPDGVRPTMLFIVYFENEDDLQKAFGLLYKEGNPCTGVKSEGDIICAFIDIFGVYWHFQVPKDWNASFVPRE